MSQFSVVEVKAKAFIEDVGRRSITYRLEEKSKSDWLPSWSFKIKKLVSGSGLISLEKALDYDKPNADNPRQFNLRGPSPPVSVCALFQSSVCSNHLAPTM